MHEILEMCVELDQCAHDMYNKMAGISQIPELASTFSQMAKEESVHVEWWTVLREAWDHGLLPDIANEHDLQSRLANVIDGIKSVRAESLEQLSGDEMLDLAVRLEFYMLDPLFGELVDLIEPGNRIEYREAYGRHILRLVDAIERHYSRPGMAKLLAGVLQRTYRDQQRLVSLAARDQLTSLYNRRGVLSHLNQWLSWSARYDHPVGVILVDLDHFKTVNDTRGHASGDAALVAVSTALESAVRGSDLVGRFGGDEFLILAPEADGEVLVQLMERLVEAIEALAIDDGAGIFRVTVSAGAAWTPGGRMIEPDTLIAQADRSMYNVKESGRGRAGVAEEVLLPA